MQLVTSDVNLGLEYRYLFPLSHARPLENSLVEERNDRTKKRHGHRCAITIDENITYYLLS